MRHRHTFETLADGAVVPCPCGLTWSEHKKIRTFSRACDFALDPPELAMMGKQDRLELERFADFLRRVVQVSPPALHADIPTYPDATESRAEREERYRAISLDIAEVAFHDSTPSQRRRSAVFAWEFSSSGRSWSWGQTSFLRTSPLPLPLPLPSSSEHLSRRLLLRLNQDEPLDLDSVTGFRTEEFK